MAKAMFTKVLIGKTAYCIRYGNRAIYRHGTLERPIEFGAMKKAGSSKQRAIVFQWLWACLADEDQNAFATPDDLAEACEGGDVLDLLVALNEAVALAQPKTPKNADSSTSSPSPASSSV